MADIDPNLAHAAFETIRLQRHQIATKIGIPLHVLDRMEITTYVERDFKSVCVAFKTYIEAGAHESKSVYVENFATWWDHFKAEAMPRWARRYFAAPEKRSELVFQPKNVYVCPHANIVWPKTQHLEWLKRTEP